MRLAATLAALCIAFAAAPAGAAGPPRAGDAGARSSDASGAPSRSGGGSPSTPAWRGRTRQATPQERRGWFEHATPEQRRRALAAERRRRIVDGLSETERKSLRERMDRFVGERATDGPATAPPRPPFTSEQRQRVRDRLRNLPPAERRRVVERLSRFRALPRTEQEAVRRRIAEFRSLDASERERIRENAARFRAMSPEKREQLRRAWERLQKLPADERRKRIDELLK